MLGRISRVRHATVGAAIGATTLLAGTGVIGGGSHPEQFDAKTVVVERIDDTVRITEYVDIDFGTNRRRGYQRVIPSDFGRPVDVVAATPDANPTLTVTDIDDTTRIRIGDPDITFTGQHRYELSYTLPDPMFQTGVLDLDIVSPLGDGFPGDNQTLEFNVVVVGFELDDPFCHTGAREEIGGCELVDDGRAFRTTVVPLPEHEGLTIGGALAGARPRIEVEPPPLPERRSSRSRGAMALGTAALGAAGAVPVYRWARRRGRNEVFAGGAVDAAYGELRPPRPGETLAPPPPVEFVADSDLADLATIEFAPPKGLEPWEGSVLITEQLGAEAIEAWLSGLVAVDAIEITEHGSDLSIASGGRRTELSADDAELLDGILSIDDPYVTGTYDEGFANAWSAIGTHQREHIARSGWWKRLPPGSGIRVEGPKNAAGVALAFGLVIAWLALGFSAFLGVFKTWPAALGVGLVFPALIAFLAYRVMLPVRSAHGSALALRTESFRRFLHASEARHVEWAWSQGILREYSAWAVALGEADAWSKALERANVPAPAHAAAGPIIVHRGGRSLNESRSAPSSSGSSGGFSSGGSGGGGGGGSSGSW